MELEYCFSRTFLPIIALLHTLRSDCLGWCSGLYGKKPNGVQLVVVLNYRNKMAYGYFLRVVDAGIERFGGAGQTQKKALQMH